MKSIVTRRSGTSAVFLAVLMMAAGFPGEPGSQPNTTVWIGRAEYFANYKNSGEINPAAGGCNYLNYDYTIRFQYVQDTNTGQFTTRDLQWSGSGKSETPGYREESCQGSGSLHAKAELTDEDQKTWQAKFPCQSKNESNNFVFTCPAKPSMAIPATVGLRMLRGGCSYSEEKPGYRYSVTVCQTQPDCISSTAFWTACTAYLEGIRDGVPSDRLEPYKETMDLFGKQVARGCPDTTNGANFAKCLKLEGKGGFDCQTSKDSYNRCVAVAERDAVSLHGDASFLKEFCGPPPTCTSSTS